MSAREQYLHERRLKAGEPIGVLRPREDDSLPSWGEILGGLAFMVQLAGCYWLLPFAVAALREIR
jgi:hypothetical protein